VEGGKEWSPDGGGEKGSWEAGNRWTHRVNMWAVQLPLEEKKKE